VSDQTDCCVPLADFNIVGFGVVEVSPAYDQAQLTALAGATLDLYMRASRR
jgi:agmatinase